MSSDEAAKKLQALQIINEALQSENQEVCATPASARSVLSHLHPRPHS
jgi:hypothetical protein